MLPGLSTEQLQAFLLQLEGLLQATLEDEVLNVEEASKLLRIGEHEVRALVRTGRLPGFRMGNGWKFSKRVLLEWVRERCREDLETGLEPLLTATPRSGARTGRR